jgi:hypothetical protein
MIDTELAKYGAWGVAIAALILVGWIVNKFLTFMKCFGDSVDANTKVTLEMHAFLKNLNGKLAKAIKSKMKE